MTAGDETGDEGRRPSDDAPAATPPAEGERTSTPPPFEEPPPPPPPVEARRTVTPGPTEGEGVGRSVSGKLVLAIVAAVLVVAVPVGLAIVASMSATETTGDTPPEARAPADEDDPAAGGGDDEDLAADLDLEGLSGRDEAFGRLLAQVDASERAMVGFQRQVAEVLEGPAGTDPGELLDELRAAAREGGEALAEVRPGLVTETGHPAADEIRSAYLTHHDVWTDYLEAVAEDPTLLGSEDEGARWTLSINASAEAFERALREELDEDLDDDVRELGEEILARGFDRGDVRPDA